MKSCPLCSGTIEPGTATFTADLGTGIVVVRHVPSLVCAQCGENWVADESASRLEAIVADAKRKGAAVEVIDLAA